MKKIIMTATIICVTAFSQAASVSWKTVKMYGNDGNVVGSDATVYVYMVNAEKFSSLSDIWGEYSNDILKNNGADAYAVKATSLSKATLYAPKDVSEANTTYYGVIIATIGTGESMMYYAEKASVLTGDDGKGAYTFGNGKLDTAATAATAWKSASIPEPTSGLLLLVGASLLALRRKQK